MLKPAKAWLLSMNFLNYSKVIFGSLSDAASKLSLIEPYFLERTRPICWMADTFQSKVDAEAKEPPNVFLKRSVEGVPLCPLAEYGFSSLTSL